MLNLNVETMKKYFMSFVKMTYSPFFAIWAISHIIMKPNVLAFQTMKYARNLKRPLPIQVGER